ncbi:MAG: RagB/SusD family nutrient uptake outer membrane protein [Bacteroidales bacterium]|jgi:hypothetical protein|nr:RagB/SusD family nutrient uptake outer membrane protein [Bacteroidales bacterium]
MNTKINQYISAGIVLLMLGMLSACSDFLDQNPQTALTPEQVFGNPEYVEPVVDGLYTSFRGTKHGREGWSLQMVGLDESKQGEVQMNDAEQSGLDYYNGALNGTHSKVTAFWDRRLPVISQATTTISSLDDALNSIQNEGLQASIRQLKGNVCFVRGSLMYELTMLWGEVPVFDEELTSTGRQALSVVWEQIFSDFTYAAENLPDQQADKPTRATSGAAFAMLGKAYMSAPIETELRDFGKAKECFEKIRSRYSLDTNYANLFSENLKFNSPESVFEFNFTCDWTGYSCWQWDMGSRTIANALGEPCYFGGYDVALPTEYAYKMKSEGGVWEEGDLRRNVAMRFDFTYMGIPFTTPAWGADELDPHIKKWEDIRTDALLGTNEAPTKSFYLSGKNYMYLRYADILLSLAECMNELGQTSEAVTVVNEVRARAWGGTLPSDKQWNALSQDEFRNQIMDERIRELCFEGWRRIDLIRTGKFVELIKERNPWAKQSGTIQPYNMRYPIPDKEIRTNDDMSPEDQNPGYN